MVASRRRVSWPPSPVGPTNGAVGRGGAHRGRLTLGLQRRYEPDARAEGLRPRTCRRVGSIGSRLPAGADRFDQDIVGYRLFPMPDRPRIGTSRPDPHRAGGYHGGTDEPHADHDRATATDRDGRIHLSRPHAVDHPRQPAAAGRDPHAQRGQLRPALPARDGGPAGPLRALRRRDRRRDPARPALEPHGRPLAHPRRRPPRGILLRLPGRRPPDRRPPLRPPHHPASTPPPAPCPAAGPGGPATDCPAAAC